MNREFVMLAHPYSGEDLTGFYWSEKLDGMRAFWDGGVSRGVLNGSVPWANTGKRSDDLCTGLWSRYGNVIYCPPFWTEPLPPVPLDGELFMGRGRFQETVGVCKRHAGGELWKDVTYNIFDTPIPDVMFTTGQIRNPNFEKWISNEECRKFYAARSDIDWFGPSHLPPVACLWNYESVWCSICNQYLVGDDLPLVLDDVLSGGGEGLILRSPLCPWTPYRTYGLLKMKESHTEVGVVLGVVPGEGKHLGRMGSLLVEWEGRRFHVSGFTDVERENPPSGSIKFRFCDCTDSGIPRNAQFERR